MVWSADSLNIDNFILDSVDSMAPGLETEKLSFRASRPVIIRVDWRQFAFKAGWRSQFERRCSPSLSLAQS